MKTIALRFGDHFAPECGTIAAHQQLIDELGYVWYGKMGNPVASAIANELKQQNNPKLLKPPRHLKLRKKPRRRQELRKYPNLLKNPKPPSLKKNPPRSRKTNQRKPLIIPRTNQPTQAMKIRSMNLT